MKMYPYKPDAQASEFIRHMKNTCTRSYVEITAQLMSVYGLWLFVRSVFHSLWLDHLRKIAPSEL